MVDYRAIPDERELFHEYRSYAFRPENGVPAYDPDEHETPRDTLGSRRGLYASDDETGSENPTPRCVCRHYWLEARVRGDAHRTAGLASVATPPEYRRQGHVRQLLARSLEEYREHDVRFSILWPFQYRFYRQYGWDTSNRVLTHDCEPEVLSFATDERVRGGRFRRLEANDYGLLESAYEAHADRYGLALERDEDWWRHRVFGGHDRDPFVYAFERGGDGNGDVAGYLVYTIDGEMGDRTMDVSELVFADHDAFLALLSFCADHDSQAQRVRLRGPEEIPLRAVARDPDEIDTTVTDGPMVRLVDVAETLSALSYPDSGVDSVSGSRSDLDADSAPNLESPLTVAVEDPLADWNDGVFRLATSAGEVSCERLTEDATPDAALEIGALSQLVVGARSASDLERRGRLEATDSGAVETLSALFPETAVYHGDRY
ncbi:GNAT family N-acetyltransferase [Natronorubrum sp. JWXQ-INN-674]|uniref:GNAT family N-acetyltransferase n=1 Tax=Natronorubrum halalkaliphilum TaxID=2691917 RepID=A0A6B0VLB9_9EURY|nr:GNAT family N-acetyltransferase [Natronorubrum halalkaliphilum]MXV62338.1 GNAT family N-acetyltransferase [Natronorubrum halalkaliphilum]